MRESDRSGTGLPHAGTVSAESTVSELTTMIASRLLGRPERLGLAAKCKSMTIQKIKTVCKFRIKASGIVPVPPGSITYWISWAT